MRAISGPGTLYGDGDLISATGLRESQDVSAPFVFVEIGCEEPASVVW
jgi:hypothetical protein